MIIGETLRGLKIKRTTGPLDREIKGIAYDSRLVKKGSVFVAIRGFSKDGHTYIKNAISRGAIGVVAETVLDLKDEVAGIEVEDSRAALASISNIFYQEPSRELSLIGITGTNGKTTTSYIVKSILEAWGQKSGLLGTISYLLCDRVIDARNTTPESLDLQAYLREMVNSGAGYAVLEVSSHALALKRVEGCLFRTAVFTNFSQDHLDFHGTMDKYFAVKSRLFEYLGKDGCAVLNTDDPAVRSLTEKLDCNVITCGFEEGAMIRAEDLSEHPPNNRRASRTPSTMPNKLAGKNKPVGDSTQRAGRQSTPKSSATGQAEHRLHKGLSLKIHTPEEELIASSELIGRNNAYNVLMAAGTAYALGISSEAIINGIKDAGAVEGRFEIFDEGQDFLCIVDYAHTEDALRGLIQEARALTDGKVITVFGCGGDRDRIKRPRMGAVAAELSDLTIITSDNPRTEDPERIIRDITDGIHKSNHTVQPDRSKAIEEAVNMAGAGDTVLVAGKGHEDYQEINGVRHPFSDKQILREEIKKRLAI